MNPAGRGREDETATETAADTTTAIGSASGGGKMGTGIEETMMGAEGTGRPIRRANAL
jgi:hypothetical protein